MPGTEKCKVVVYSNNKRSEFFCEQGSNLKEALANNGFYIDAPCGGKGSCGKCKVKISGAENISPTNEDMRHIDRAELDKGYRLSCTFKVTKDIEVEIRHDRGNAQIVTSGQKYKVDLNPKIVKQYLSLERPTINDQRDDVKRLVDAIGIANLSIPLSIMKELPELLRNNEYNITVVHDHNRVLKIEGGDTTKSCFGIAIDIGTTTIAVYLVDLVTGKEVDVLSELNGQKSYGADVISRINYTMENSDGIEQLRKTIVTQLDSMIKELAEKNNVNTDNIYHIMIAANTTMLHLFLGLATKYIALSPFIPVNTACVDFTAEELGFNLNKACVVTLLPCVSAYVGADIVAGIISSGMTKKDEASLLIDIGTNGEIVLSTKNGMYCCSTAAGPAFEGAHIRNGCGGIPGAINSVKIENGELKYTTISDLPPIGICGSAIVDIVAILVENEIIDEGGRFNDEEDINSDTGRKLLDRITQIDGQPAFVISKDPTTNEVIAITQKDIRELQLAKAAIAAGIRILINSAGLNVNDVQKVYFAGGFGSYINKSSAIKIGLIPKEFENKIVVLGNAAGTGAKMCLISKNKLKESDKILNRSKYIELSSLPEFQNEFVDCMYF